MTNRLGRVFKAREKATKKLLTVPATRRHKPAAAPAEGGIAERPAFLRQIQLADILRMTIFVG